MDIRWDYEKRFSRAEHFYEIDKLEYYSSDQDYADKHGLLSFEENGYIFCYYPIGQYYYVYDNNYGLIKMYLNTLTNHEYYYSYDPKEWTNWSKLSKRLARKTLNNSFQIKSELDEIRKYDKLYIETLSLLCKQMKLPFSISNVTPFYRFLKSNLDKVIK